MEYIVISQTGSKGVLDTSNFVALVNEKLSDGFELHGSMGAVFDPEHVKVIYFQALIKK